MLLFSLLIRATLCGTFGSYVHNVMLCVCVCFADIFLPGAYPRSLEPATAYQHLHYPYNMAIAKGSSFEGEGSVTKKPRTVFTPKQLLYLEEEFSGNQFPNMEQRKKIAKTLDLTQQHIQVCVSPLCMLHLSAFLSFPLCFSFSMVRHFSCASRGVSITPFSDCVY